MLKKAFLIYKNFLFGLKEITLLNLLISVLFIVYLSYANPFYGGIEKVDQELIKYEKKLISIKQDLLNKNPKNIEKIRGLNQFKGCKGELNIYEINVELKSLLKGGLVRIYLAEYGIKILLILLLFRLYYERYRYKNKKNYMLHQWKLIKLNLKIYLFSLFLSGVIMGYMGIFSEIDSVYELQFLGGYYYILFLIVSLPKLILMLNFPIVIIMLMTKLAGILKIGIQDSLQNSIKGEQNIDENIK